MRRTTRIWLTIAAFLVLLGFLLFAGAMTMYHWDFSAMSSVQMETRRQEISGTFRNISIDTDTDDITFVPSADGKCTVVFVEAKKVDHTASVKDGTLTIGVNDTRNWMDRFMIFGNYDPSVTVYLPQRDYAALSIKESTGDVTIPGGFTFESIAIEASTGDADLYASASGNIRIALDTGDITMDNVSAAACDLKVSTGRMEISNVSCTGDIKASFSTGKSKFTNVSCANFISTGDTGSTKLSNVIASGKMSIERTTGDVEFDACDAAELTVKTDTGDVTGTLLPEKIIFAKSDTGKVEVPVSAGGDKCEITTDTGDIKISVK